MKGRIYGLIDPTDNEIKYIGQTKFKLEKRYKEHIRNCKYDLTKNQKIYMWINGLIKKDLYPTINLIEEVDYTKLNIREEYWIKHYNKTGKLTNTLAGGNHLKFIEKKPFTDSHKQKIGDSCRGEKHYNYGKKADNVKGVVKLNKINGNYIEDYDSIKIASEATNINRAAISMCASGKRKTAGDFIWIHGTKKYDFDLINQKVEECRSHPNNTATSRMINKIDINTNEVIETYPSIRSAGRNNNTSDTNIRYALKNNHHHMGYKWEYNDEEE
jgi:hypothetical protein